ncbi:MAG: hypothetical protein JNK65_00415 [Deltaproteobacteria bacterium]|nr:hypothetical protein [Deltaproteobacteria bacterium]
MKRFFFISALLFSLSHSQKTLADPPLISGNGFSCVKSQILVTCQGQFPGVAGIFSSSGTYGVQLSYDTPPPRPQRFLFDSTTGCLMQIQLGPAGESLSVFVKNSAGRSKQFVLPLQSQDAFSFCKVQ